MASMLKIEYRMYDIGAEKHLTSTQKLDKIQSEISKHLLDNRRDLNLQT